MVTWPSKPRQEVNEPVLKCNKAVKQPNGEKEGEHNFLLSEHTTKKKRYFSAAVQIGFWQENNKNDQPVPNQDDYAKQIVCNRCACVYDWLRYHNAQLQTSKCDELWLVNLTQSLTIHVSYDCQYPWGQSICKQITLRAVTALVIVCRHFETKTETIRPTAACGSGRCVMQPVPGHKCENQRGDVWFSHQPVVWWLVFITPSLN